MKKENDMIPILEHKRHDMPSIFTPTSLLREARRQKSMSSGNIPEFCVLDPDGDLSRHLKSSGAKCNPNWACYHTELFNLELQDMTVGVLGCAVGASFAVLVAEEMFASGCRILMSVTSSGQIVPSCRPPCFVLIDRALRDEGTSYHYMPPAPYSMIRGEALNIAKPILTDSTSIVQGGVWTTDAPFRETEEAFSFARAQNLLAVEMEAAALYAYAEAAVRPIICFARITNQMGTIENDFEKGKDNGNEDFIDLISKVAHAWRDGR